MSTSEREYEYGVAPAEHLQALSGHDFLVAIRDGELPAPPMARTLGFELAEIEAGRVVFRATPSRDYYNPLGSVHGGWPATLLDSCMGCAVHSTLPAGTGYTTLEFKIDILRPITETTGPVAAEGRVVRVGRRVGVAEGVLTDGAGRVLARGTTTCLVFGH